MWLINFFIGRSNYIWKYRYNSPGRKTEDLKDGENISLNGRPVQKNPKFVNF